MSYVERALSLLAKDSQREVLVGAGRRYTRGAARDLLLRFADGLASRGVRPGDGVAVHVGNTPEAVLLTMAVHLLGCRLVFVPPEPGERELRGLVERAEVALIVIDPEFDARLGGCLISDLPGEPVQRTPAPDLSTVFYTGGTTGAPKLATHGPTIYAPQQTSHWTQPTVLVSTLVTHSAGHLFCLLGLLNGSKVVLGRIPFDIEEFVRVARDEAITAANFNPMMLSAVLDHPDCPPHLDSVSLAGAAFAPDRLRQALQRWGPVVWQVYGMTEALGVSIMYGHEVDLSRPDTLRSVGRPNPGMEVEIRDGRIWTRGPYVMRGYWGEPPVDDWYDTGDVGQLDEDGHLYVLDRDKDTIVTHTAVSIYPRLLDDFLTTLPGIRDAAAVGRPDGTGEVVHVFLVVESGFELDLAKLREQVVAELGHLYFPDDVTVIDALPLTTMGKIDKKALRASLRR